MSLLNTEILPFKAQAYANGEFVELTEASLKGHWSVVFFYPADFTFVCPTELEDLAENYAEFKSLGVEVYAVSTDTHFTHKAWHESSAAVGKVQFPMIGDLRMLSREELELYDEDIKNMRDIYATRKFDEKKGMEKEWRKKR